MVDEEGRKTAVVLPIEEYERMLEALREADEALEALQRGEEDPLPLEEAI
jgi:PHD/YefM family antitoxin component YafN of YafNO toxin-antitoxin module